MNRRDKTDGCCGVKRNVLAGAATVCLGVTLIGGVTAATAQVPSTAGHVSELAGYLEDVQIAEPVVYRQLAVYPVLFKGGDRLGGRWLTLDEAISRGKLEITEKGSGGSVPVVVVHNRSRDEHVFIMSGEVISGGKQTRTVRKDVVLAPGERIELDVYCVEAHRWTGGKRFSGSGAVLPQSIQKELRRGADQSRLWSEVARNNRALQAENATGSLELALKSRPVQDKLAEVRRSIVPRMPQGTVGYIFVDRGRAVGAEFFGRADLARDLLPKLLDSYAVDFVILHKAAPHHHGRIDHNAAVEYFKRVCRAGSQRTSTPGSGSGIRTRGGGLLGDGVSLSGSVVHYGVQIQDRIIPHPTPHPRPMQQR